MTTQAPITDPAIIKASFLPSSLFWLLLVIGSFVGVGGFVGAFVGAVVVALGAVVGAVVVPFGAVVGAVVVPFGAVVGAVVVPFGAMVVGNGVDGTDNS